MSNFKRNLSGLEKGRGKRPKENNESVSMRLPSRTCLALEDIAKDYGIMYGDKPWISGLLRKIGDGELMVVPATPGTKQRIQERLENRLQERLERRKQRGEEMRKRFRKKQR